MIKLLLSTIPFLVLYMAFAFVVWDIAWVANCEWTLRAFYIITSSLFSLVILDKTEKPTSVEYIVIVHKCPEFWTQIGQKSTYLYINVHLIVTK